jgi:hypothetical protein
MESKMKPYYIRKEISQAQQDAIDSIEVTPEMLKNAQKFSGLGATVCASMIGSYDLITEMYKVMRATEIASNEHDAEVIDNFADSLALQAESFPEGVECEIKGSSWYNWQMYFVRKMKSYANTLRHAGKPNQKAQE